MCGSFKQTLSSKFFLLKNQVIRLRTLGEEAFGATVVRSKLDNKHDLRNCHPVLCSVQRKID